MATTDKTANKRQSALDDVLTRLENELGREQRVPSGDRDLHRHILRALHLLAGHPDPENPDTDESATDESESK